MRIREMIGEQDSWASDTEEDPEPTSHDLYVEQVLDISRQLEQDRRIRYKEWRGEDKDSVSVKVQPGKIHASLAGCAFDNYRALNVEERHVLEAVASRTMSRVDGRMPADDMQVMINYVPLLFHPERVAIIGHREYDSSFITFKSDKLWTPTQRSVLLGGLATVLYYAENPLDLYTVE